MADIVVRDHRRKVDQRTSIERCRQGNEVRADQPFVRAVQHDAGDDEQKPDGDKPIQIKAATRQQVSK